MAEVQETVWRRFERQFGGGPKDSLEEVERRFGEGRETVWRRSRDGLAEVERRLGGGLNEMGLGGLRDSLVEVRQTVCRRSRKDSSAKNVRELSSPLRERKSVKKVSNTRQE